MRASGAAQATPRRDPVIALRAISKTFFGVPALRDIHLEIHSGEVLALMGENGAGKSTTIKIITGAYRPDPGGAYQIDGQTIDLSGPDEARSRGIAVVYQEHSLCPNLTVAENIFLGRPLQRRGFVDRSGMQTACAPVLERLGADFHAHDCVSGLSIAQRQMVEIARALQFGARVLIMDEPTTSLSRRETDRLFALIKRLRAEGLGIVYISHRMDEVYELADRVSVLRDGQYAGTLAAGQISHDALVRMMVGRDLSGFYTKGHAGHGTGRTVLSVQGLGDGRRIRDCSFEVKAGEVLGLAGLVGAGRTELARLIFGADKPTTGRVLVDGRAVAPGEPRRAIDAGIVYLTEDRRHQGLFLDMSVHHNINVMVAGRESRAGFLDLASAARRSEDAGKRLAIRTASLAANIGSLSGGNQQKGLIARLLAVSPRVLILDEPTRGVDVGAKAEIYRLIDDLARTGVAIVVISSELPEVVGICDRVIVMREGAFAGELGGPGQSAATSEAIVSLATQAAPQTDKP